MRDDSVLERISDRVFRFTTRRCDVLKEYGVPLPQRARHQNSLQRIPIGGRLAPSCWSEPKRTRHDEQEIHPPRIQPRMARIQNSPSAPSAQSAVKESVNQHQHRRLLHCIGRGMNGKGMKTENHSSAVHSLALSRTRLAFKQTPRQNHPQRVPT
jgi:hypothetical protein